MLVMANNDRFHMAASHYPRDAGPDCYLGLHTARQSSSYPLARIKEPLDCSSQKMLSPTRRPLAAGTSTNHQGREHELDVLAPAPRQHNNVASLLKSRWFHAPQPGVKRLEEGQRVRPGDGRGTRCP